MLTALGLASKGRPCQVDHATFEESEKPSRSLVQTVHVQLSGSDPSQISGVPRFPKTLGFTTSVVFNPF
jgi:hypothetical protein